MVSLIVVAKTKVLTVGIDGQAEALRELPIRLISLKTGKEAVRSLKNEQYDSVISKWHLSDMKDGKFLKGLKNIKPDMPTIAVINPGDQQQEISARSLGVSAVISDDISDEHFKQIVCDLLGLKDAKSIEEIYALKGNER